MGYVLISASGEKWTQVYNAKAYDLHTCCFGSSMFVAGGESDGADSYLLTSLRASLPVL
jgi:hypothetical protein